MLKAAFVGVVLTATSVSITVETLRELGKLKSRVGTAILGAAVIDDILGIVVLTVLTAFTDPTVQPLLVFGRIVLFFVFVLVVGLLMHKVFGKMEQLWHHHRRIAIYALVFAFLMSYAAERFFGIADITGAYFAGIVMCNLSATRDYVASKTNVLGYMLFSRCFCVYWYQDQPGGADRHAGSVRSYAYADRNRVQDHRLRPWGAADGLPGV